jgi:hypothetical protein
VLFNSFFLNLPPLRGEEKFLLTGKQFSLIISFLQLHKTYESYHKKHFLENKHK